MSDGVLLSQIVEDGTATGKMEMDARGHVRFIPNDAELASIETYLADELTRTLDDYAPIFQDAADSISTYRCTKKMIEGSGRAILPAPIARIPADHIIAGEFNAIMRARPVFSFDAYSPGEFPVVIPSPPPEEGFPAAIPQGTPMQVRKNAEEIGKNLERGFEFKIRERLDFETKLFKSVRAAVIGCPFWWKTCADPQYRDVMGPKAGGAFIDLKTKYSFRQEGEVVQVYLVPFFNFIKPLDINDDDLDEGPWCAERRACEPNDIIRGFYSKEYFLIKTLVDAERIAKNVSDVHNPYQQAIAAVTEKKSPSKQRQLCDRWLVWFYRDARFEDENGDEQVRRLNLLGDFHLGEKRLLNCFLNPNDHQSRPYVLVDQMEESDSTVKILRWHQDVATHIMQAQIKNAFIANNINYWCNPESSAYDYFKSHPAIGPGEVLLPDGVKDTDWGSFSAGTEHESLLPTWSAVVSEARAASTVSSVRSGETIPGRTPAATMSQSLEQGAQQDLLFLRRLSRKLSRIVRLYLETARQFQPMGETIPIFDPVQKQLIEIPFRFPVGDVLDNYRIALTAADDALRAERNVEQIATWKAVLMQDSEFVAKVATAMIDQRATPAMMALFEKTLTRNEKLVTRMIQLSDTDEADFDLTEEINALVKEKELAAQMMRAQEAMNAQSQTAAPQGAVPGPAGLPNGGGPVGMGVEPGIGAGAPPPQEGGVQQSPQYVA